MREWMKEAKHKGRILFAVYVSASKEAKGRRKDVDFGFWESQARSVVAQQILLRLPPPKIAANLNCYGLQVIREISFWPPLSRNPNALQIGSTYVVRGCHIRF